MGAYDPPGPYPPEDCPHRAELEREPVSERVLFIREQRRKAGLSECCGSMIAKRFGKFYCKGCCKRINRD